MRKQPLSSVVFWCLAAASLVLLVAFVLVLAGVVPIDEPSQPREPAERVGAPAATTRLQAETTPAGRRRGAEQTTTAPRAAKARAPALTVVVVTATRGDSWFSARLGSASGRVLDERVLAQGESARLEGRKIWLTVGAAGNVDVTVDGKPQPLAPGTVSTVLPGASPPRARS